MTKLLFRTLGIVLLTMSIMALGACISQHQEPMRAQTETPQPQITVPQNSCQRFVFVINPNMRADTFLLDTQTGKVWQRTHITDFVGEPDIWSPMLRPETEQDVYSALTAVYTPKSAKKSKK
jgi:hypothetical protein